MPSVIGQLKLSGKEMLLLFQLHGTPQFLQHSFSIPSAFAQCRFQALEWSHVECSRFRIFARWVSLTCYTCFRWKTCLHSICIGSSCTGNIYSFVYSKAYHLCRSGPSFWSVSKLLTPIVFQRSDHCQSCPLQDRVLRPRPAAPNRVPG